jgi:DNA topoisomerase-3
MILILNEKPSQARNFAKALGGMTGKYNGQSYEIVPLRGHVYEFSTPDKQVPKALQEEYHKWSLDTLPWDETQFAWKRDKAKDVSSVIANVVSAAKNCDSIYVATDDDPTGEGQLLAFEVFKENPAAFRGKKFFRMYFADESVKEVQKAFINASPIPNLDDDPDYKKALYRAKWDFMSMQWSRIATLCGDRQSVLRQGRLKSAMVLLVGDQLKAVNSYKKVPFYSNRFKDENGVVYTNPDEPVFKTKGEVPQIYTDSPVAVDSKITKKSAPPKLIDLAGLSAKLAPKGIKAKTVLATYQKMYEAQVVSYPRTEDAFITPEQFNDLLPYVDKIAKLVGVDTSALTHRSPRKTHVKTGCAHGANRPGTNVPSSLSDLDSKYGQGARAIYEILAKSYLAMLAEDYEYEQQKGHLEKYPDFKGTANVPKVSGWHAVSYDADDDADADESNTGLGCNASPFIYEGFPPKPQAPTMKWLMKQLEKRNVGTGATRTSTYADVTNDKSKYPLMKESRGKISMAPCGQMSYLLLPGTHIGDLSITEQVMSDMDAIAKGEKDADVCLHGIQQMIVDDIAVMKKNGESMRKELNVETKDFKQKEKYEGTWNGKKVSFNREWGGHRFTDDECQKLCDGEEIEVLGLTSKAGKTYGITGRLAELEYNGHKYIGFERTGFANSKTVPDSWCKHDFTAKEKEDLEGGAIVHIDGAVSKKGNVFSCDVKFGEREDGSMGIIPQFNK